MLNERYWIPHPEQVFAPATLQSIDGDKALFKDEAGEALSVPAKDVPACPKVHDAQLVGVDNICTLEEVNEGALLHAVKVRYLKTQVYTRVARILIAVNPFQSLPIYSGQYLEKYRRAPESMDLPPHVFGIGLDAVNGLRRGDGKNQAVLISGESGAGKTESTKLILSYITDAVGGGSGGIQDRIMQTNPILESFGNAMTVRNNNSSRFGKWLQMTVNSSLTIQSCTVTDYLLELTRVNQQGPKERNYHVFFQLITCRNNPELKELGIGTAKDYVYTKDCQEKAPGVDDVAFFEDLKEAFDGLDFSKETQQEVFRIVAGILTMGNIDFKEDGEAAALVNEEPLIKTAALFGIDVDTLKKPTLVRRIVVGKDVTEAKRTAPQAKAARDGLVRLLYGRLFKWLIERINAKLSGGASSKVAGQFFGVLDIAGFESFEQNSLEQLFINLSNEHLQNFFNNHIFKMELDDYKLEGVSVDAGLSYQDNSDILSLIDSKGGILAVLDEEVAMPKATDATFLSKVFKAHDKHARLIVPKFAGKAEFGIRHFAGDVTYSTNGFLEKNIDKPPDEAPDLLRASNLKILKDLGEKMAVEVQEAASGGRGKKAKTVSSGFRTSLASLVEKLNTAEPHFVRCIKPNPEKLPNKVSPKTVMEQLLCSGVFEAVRIRQSGFASRVPFQDFLRRYKGILPKATQQKIFGGKAPSGDFEEAKGFLEALPAALVSGGGLQEGEIVLGKSKFFAKTRIIGILEKTRDLSISGYAVDIQRLWRGKKVRMTMAACQEVFSQLAGWLKNNNFYSAPGSQHTALAKLKTPAAIEEQVQLLEGIMKQAQKLPLPTPKQKQLEKVKGRMENEVREMKQLKAVENSLEVMEIEKALARLRDLELDVPEVTSLATRAKRLTKQLPLVKAMEDALAKPELKLLQELMDLVKAEGLSTRPEDWIVELRGEQLAGSVYNELQELKSKQKLADIEKKRKEELQQKLEQEKAKAEVAFEAESEKSKLDALPSATVKQRRATITGMSEEDQQRCLVSIIAACGEYDLAGIEKGLNEAIRQGIEENDTIRKAKDLFEKLGSEAFVLGALKELEESIMEEEEDPDAKDLRKLQNMMNQAKRLNVPPDALGEAKKIMQKAIRSRARNSIHGVAFDQVELQELQLVEGTFSDLANFAGLKPKDKWRGHRSFLPWDTQSDKMLVHMKLEIREALTKIPAPEEPDATENFKNILGWMGDKPMPQTQRKGCAQDAVAIAKKSRSLSDETFVQVLKQLRENPSPKSMLEGWKLLLLLCQQVCPTAELEEFLRAFLLKAIQGDNVEVKTMAKQSILDLNTLTSKSATKGLEKEDIPTTVVQVLLIDYSTRKLTMPTTATLSDLATRAAEQLKISTPEDFAFFQVTDGLDQHRLLPGQCSLALLDERWAKLKQVTGRASRLLYKRSFITAEEELKPGDLMHATLTYRQVLHDALSYPVSEPPKVFAELAAAILHAERDCFEPYINAKNLTEEGVLEQLLPDVAFRELDRRQWSVQVLEELAKAEATESRLMRMSRVLVMAKKLKLFGVYFWQARQSLSPPLTVLDQAPRLVCKINPKDPESEYWFCIDPKGIRFVSVDSKPGMAFSRGFNFDHESMEKVVTWGAKKNVVHIVVATVDPANAAAGQVNQTISLICPAAVDVAFTIHAIIARFWQVSHE